MNRLILLVESRIRGDVYVRFGGELPKTHRSNTAGRWMLSLPLKSVNNLVKDARKVQQTILMVGDITDGRIQRRADGAEERGEHHHALHDGQGAHGRGGTLPLQDEALPQPRELLHQQEHQRELPACEEEKRPRPHHGAVREHERKILVAYGVRQPSPDSPLALRADDAAVR